MNDPITQFEEAKKAATINEAGQAMRDSAKAQKEGVPDLDEEYSKAKLDMIIADHRDPNIDTAKENENIETGTNASTSQEASQANEENISIPRIADLEVYRQKVVDDLLKVLPKAPEAQSNPIQSTRSSQEVTPDVPATLEQPAAPVTSESQLTSQFDTQVTPVSEKMSDPLPEEEELIDEEVQKEQKRVNESLQDDLTRLRNKAIQLDDVYQQYLQFMRDDRVDNYLTKKRMYEEQNTTRFLRTEDLEELQNLPHKMYNILEGDEHFEEKIEQLVKEKNQMIELFDRLIPIVNQKQDELSRTAYQARLDVNQFDYNDDQIREMFHYREELEDAENNLRRAEQNVTEMQDTLNRLRRDFDEIEEQIIRAQRNLANP